MKGNFYRWKNYRLIELGTGFNPELSGEVNIRNNALLLGMTEVEIDNRFEDIVLFAEIGSFIKPLKVYSSGMLMRLALLWHHLIRNVFN